jgi:RNA polymerase sigma-70 factor (ECF subfamily)
VTRDELIVAAQRGDQAAFASLAALEIDRLHAIATLILRDMDLAQDAVQEALIRCWRQIRSLRDIGSFDGWLRRILIRAVADEASRRRRFAASVQMLRVEPHDDRAPAIAEREQLERAFARLSVEHRAVVVLRHYADLPLAEVAEILGIPLGTTKSRYHYAMAGLRAALEAEDRRLASAEGRA